MKVGLIRVKWLNTHIGVLASGRVEFDYRSVFACTSVSIVPRRVSRYTNTPRKL